jgi:hypothetical protein
MHAIARARTAAITKAGRLEPEREPELDPEPDPEALGRSSAAPARQIFRAARADQRASRRHSAA